MSGTIVGNIALGASDWSEWITRQERGERGFLRASLSNFSDTTASTIVSGSVLEVAGSIYQFTTAETITLATSTASVNVAVYYRVIPSAGGTTCTIEMSDAAPVWRDDYQGFYASAASITRVIGGCYIGSALVYYSKFLFDNVPRPQRMDRGFMQASLTNFSATTASTITKGSVIECAGWIYTFGDTPISLASGTPSANVAVYYIIIPSAGGTTCTVEMNSTVPIWNDARQGFYASALSINRAIGGCYIGSAAVYYGKFLYRGDHLQYCLETGTTRPLLTSVVNIGEWNMDAATAVSIVSSIHYLRIRAAAVTIMADDGLLRPLDGHYYTTDHDKQGDVVSYTIGNTIWLSRKTGGLFDSVTFDGTASTVPNRGWIVVTYEA